MHKIFKIALGNATFLGIIDIFYPENHRLKLFVSWNTDHISFLRAGASCSLKGSTV